jgi:hypothetical protein
VKKHWLVGMAVCALALGACSDDDGGDVRTVGDDGTGSASGSGSGSGSGTGSGSASGSAVAAECEPVGDEATATATVNVELTEFEVTADPATVAPGVVHFAIANVGAEPHELVVVRADDPATLPTDENGGVDEAALPEGAFIGEVEGFPGGETCDGTFELPAGEFALFCTITEEEEDGTIENHYAEGMYTGFTVG